MPKPSTVMERDVVRKLFPPNWPLVSLVTILMFVVHYQPSSCLVSEFEPEFDLGCSSNRPCRQSLWSNSTNLLGRSKREVYRGQNYHYQRGYELNRLRYENRLQSDPFAQRPKAFFVREYHQGRDVPKELLQLARLQQTDDDQQPPADSATTTTTTTSTLIEAAVSSQGDDNMKTMSDYQQRLYATKAALKAAIESGDKDLSILQYIKAKNLAKNRDKSISDTGANDGDKSGQPDANRANRDEQTKESDKDHHANDGGNENDLSAKDGADPNKNVLFDEQIKEDLNKIAAYDPRKAFGERLRPYNYNPNWNIPRTSPYGNSSPGGAGSRPHGGPQFGQRTPTDSYLNKIRRIYPHLFPSLPGTSSDSGPSGQGYPDSGRNGAGGRGGGSSGGDDGRTGHPETGGGSGSSGAGGPSSPSGDRVNSNVGPLISTYPDSGLRTPDHGRTSQPSSFANRTGSLYPSSRSPLPGASLYPSRFPNNRLSVLTLHPNVRNSTYPGIPGYIRYDYPGYSKVPYTGFRCDLQAYKYGYFADVAAGCQVFHVCQKDGRMDSFLCPNGTLFHQKVMTCDWWYHVHCPSSPSYYYLNGRIGVLPFLPATLNRFD